MGGEESNEAEAEAETGTGGGTSGCGRKGGEGLVAEAGLRKLGWWWWLWQGGIWVVTVFAGLVEWLMRFGIQSSAVISNGLDECGLVISAA